MGKYYTANKVKAATKIGLPFHVIEAAKPLHKSSEVKICS